MYAQKEKPKENKSRAVANSVAQKKSNRAHSEQAPKRCQAKIPENVRSVRQMKKTEVDMVAGDYWFDQRNNVKKLTKEAYQNIKGYLSNRDDKDINDIIKNNRKSCVNYMNHKSSELDETWLNNIKGVMGKEHMYVLVNNVIYARTRDTENEKHVAHPTLVGGDPDAKGAGLIKVNSRAASRRKGNQNAAEAALEVIVDDSSGHFKLGGTEAKVAKKIEYDLGGKDIIHRVGYKGRSNKKVSFLDEDRDQQVQQDQQEAILTQEEKEWKELLAMKTMEARKKQKREQPEQQQQQQPEQQQQQQPEQQQQQQPELYGQVPMAWEQMILQVNNRKMTADQMKQRLGLNSNITVEQIVAFANDLDV